MLRVLFYNATVDYNHWTHVNFIIDNIFLVGMAAASGSALLYLSLQNLGAKASALQATQLMNRGKTLILDVRDAAQFANAHLRDAKNITLSELSARLNELEKFKSLPVIVVCQNGNQSSKATAQLKRAGFDQAVSLEGGLTAWQTAGLPTTKEIAKEPVKLAKGSAK